ncbi:MAG: hypothetical protein C4518_01940 [Desulfobacteraceae bacterium]|nr:MAG: hypothetical protein C4518_01940 [Desulfobacteraceae bacterium]
MDMPGYSHPQYALSLAEFGTPHELPECGGWILERHIQGWPYSDAMGCYPLFVCRDWSKLGEDIQKLEGKLISLSLVTDPFADIAHDKLADIFNVCIKYKEHYIADLTEPIELFVRKNSLRFAKNALKDLIVDSCVNPKLFFSEWVILYNSLIKRHKILGIRAFSEQSFQKLFTVPGLEMFIARLGYEIVGAAIWLVQDNIGYGHLMAISPLGYDFNAAYALNWTAIQHFSKSLRWLDFGSGPGLSQKEDGLTAFKKGWTNKTLPVYLCGKVLDQKIYAEISGVKGLSVANYFPAYRSGEFL